MGRAPCCDKANVKKGPWSPEEDATLKAYIEHHGTGGNWIALPQKIGLKRCGKSCRLRWLNYLRPNIKHGGFSDEEDRIICSLYISIGSRWSIIAAQLPGRTDNDIKNYWNTRLKKKLLGKQRKDSQQSRRVSGLKQDMNKAKEIKTMMNNPSAVARTDYNPSPYWPQLPVLPQSIPYSHQEMCPNDHNSIRKLLIKLGGNFSTEDRSVVPHETATNLEVIPSDNNNVVSASQQFYESSMHSILSNGDQMMDAFSNRIYQLANIQLEAARFEMLQSMNNNDPVSHENELGQAGISPTANNGLDGLEFLFGDDQGAEAFGCKNAAEEYCDEFMNFRDMSSMVYPRQEDLHQQGKTQQDGNAVDKLRYS